MRTNSPEYLMEPSVCRIYNCRETTGSDEGSQMKTSPRARLVLTIACTAVLVAAAGLFPLSCGSSSFPKADAQRVEESLEILMQQMKIPGVLFALYDPAKGDLILQKGSSDVRNGTGIMTDNTFRIGSVTKTFTSVMVLQLAQEGKLAIDDPLSKYRPDVPNSQNISLRQLLNHTCGLFSYTDDAGFVSAIETDPLRKWTPDEVINIGISHPPEFPPGQGWGYSNTAYVLLGKVIEQVTGNTYASEIKKRIIKPLALKHTVLPTDAEMPGRYSHGYTFDLGNGMQDITRQQVPTWGWSAGGLVSDLTDMKICAKAFAQGKLLNKTMRSEFLEWVPMPVEPGRPPNAFSALGIGKYKGMIGNTGGTYGYTTWMWYIPEKDATLIAFFNETSAFDPALSAKEQTWLAEFLETVIKVI